MRNLLGFFFSLFFFFFFFDCPSPQLLLPRRLFSFCFSCFLLTLPLLRRSNATRASRPSCPLSHTIWSSLVWWTTCHAQNHSKKKKNKKCDLQHTYTHTHTRACCVGFWLYNPQKQEREKKKSSLYQVLYFFFFACFLWVFFFFFFTRRGAPLANALSFLWSSFTFLFHCFCFLIRASPLLAGRLAHQYRVWRRIQVIGRYISIKRASASSLNQRKKKERFFCVPYVTAI